MTPGEAFGYPDTWDWTELPARYRRKPLATLPPDLTTGGGLESDRMCLDELHLEDAWGHDIARYCTRRTGHSGRHAAGTGQIVIAVW
jgi:hypothetical protein